MVEENLRKAAKTLFDEGKVKLIIGFEEGSLPMRASPAFIRSADETKRLTWNSFCENNLASYIRYYIPSLEDGERIGVVAKGCDARSLICLLKEKQFKREQIVIIGVKCQGMIDWKRIRDEVAPDDILEAKEEKDEIDVRTRSSQKKFKKSDYLYDNCQECDRREPVINDFIVEAAEQGTGKKDRWSRIKEFEQMTPEERWKYFKEETSRCIRCYACRNACPVCYCSECFVDSTMPYWVGTTLESSDVQVFHLIRALHTAGRCTYCGNCTQACPMGIDIAFLVGKLSKDVQELFSHEVGVDPDEPPALSAYSEKDSNEDFA
ncbi:4Fe-4S ferredoxin [candidate division TA06 bacterium]|uniref:4Fe-4S ferredoxin n=1 Tax=candidate division TA06 bacterium TaxID=2250710 RepID=A0A523UYD8_UNCT6|nr:MAG: 4Fe-4S ferredoxin [candidate division TA06 bacterium]